MTNSALLKQFSIDSASETPVYRQIIDRVYALIASGVLVEGDRIPTIRELTVHLNLNPNTVARAVMELELKGVIETCRGRGSFVADTSRLFRLTEAEKQEKLQTLFTRMFTAAAALGITEPETTAWLRRCLNTGDKGK